jgi:hypothetical protein
MTLLRLVVIALGAGILVGCSSSGAAKPAIDQEMADLQEVQRLLHVAARQTGRTPARLADLEPFQSKWQEAYESVKSGNFVVLWGTPVSWGMPTAKTKADAGKPELVLAYAKAVPTNGGYVLTSAGKITKMSAAEFASAPKSKK